MITDPLSLKGARNDSLNLYRIVLHRSTFHSTSNSNTLSSKLPTPPTQGRWTKCLARICNRNCGPYHSHLNSASGSLFFGADAIGPQKPPWGSEVPLFSLFLPEQKKKGRGGGEVVGVPGARERAFGERLSGGGDAGRFGFLCFAVFSFFPILVEGRGVVGGLGQVGVRGKEREGKGGAKGDMKEKESRESRAVCICVHITFSHSYVVSLESFPCPHGPCP